VETINPSLDIASPTSGAIVFSSTVTVTWTVNSPSGAVSWIKLDGGLWDYVSGQTSHTFTSLPDGHYVVTIQITDNAGNSNETTVDFIVDIAPVMIAHSPTGNGVAISSAIGVTFSKAMNESSVEVVLDGVIGTTTWSGNALAFMPSSALAYDTTYSVNVSGKDLAGNPLGTTTWTFTTLKNEGAISGTILDASDNPVANVMVSLSNGMTTTTNSTGGFSLSNVPSGSYNVTFSKEGYNTITRSVATAAGETTNLGPVKVEATPSSSDNTVLYIGIGAVAIVLLALLLFVLMRRRKT
jgi:hypothetical protein